MKDYLEIAEILGLDEVKEIVKDAEKKLEELIKKEEVSSEDTKEIMELEPKLRKIVKDALKQKLSDEQLELLNSLAVLDLPILLEVAKDVYDSKTLKDLVEMGLLKQSNGYIFFPNKTLKEILEDNQKEEYHKLAVEYYERLEKNIDVLTELAYHHLKLGNYDKSFDLFISTANQIYGRHRCVEKLIAIGEKLIDKVDEKDRVIGTLGNLYFVLKKYREAEKYYKAVLEEYVKKEDSRVVGVLNNLANLYYVKGEYKKAEEMYKECLSLAMDKGDEDVMINVLTALSSLYMDLNEYEKAESCLLDALRIESKRKSDKPSVAVASLLNNLGFVYSKAKDYEKAERFYKEALRIYNQLDDVKGVIAVLNNLSSIYLTTGNVDKALDVLDVIKKFLKDIPPDLKAKFYFLSAKALEKKNELKSALDYYLKAGALGFLVFRNFGINAINFMHSLDKAEELAKKLKLTDVEGDVKLMKSCILRKYYGVRTITKPEKCSERGKALLKALDGEKPSVNVRDEVDSLVFVLINDMAKG